MTQVRTTIVTSIMAPHRIALFNSLAADPAIDLTVIYLAETDPSRHWSVRQNEMKFRHVVLTERARFGRAEGFLHLTTGLRPALGRSRPQALIVGGWDQPAYHEARAYAWATGSRLLWWVESTLRDRRSEGRSARSLKRSLIASADGVVVPGQASTDYVRSLGATDDRIWVAPNAVDNESFRLVAPDRTDRRGSVRFLFVGRFTSSKGIASLLDAWMGVKTDAYLSLVGAGDLADPILRRISATSTERVDVVGHLERDDLAKAYADADVFIFPSVSDPWGLVINEAMASGLPVIASDAPGAVADLVTDGENGLIVEAFDPASLAAAMSRLALDRDLRLGMGRRSADRIKSFEPANWAAGMRRAVVTATEAS